MMVSYMLLDKDFARVLRYCVRRSVIGRRVQNFREESERLIQAASASAAY